MDDNIYRKVGYGMDDSETPYLNGYDMKQNKESEVMDNIKEVYRLGKELNAAIEMAVREGYRVDVSANSAIHIETPKGFSAAIQVSIDVYQRLCE